MQIKIILLIAAVYLLGFFAHAFYLQKTVYGDGIFYYSWLRSTAIDKDINFRNEYQHFEVNQPGNKYSIGPALHWAPSYIWTHYLVRGNGYEFAYELVVGLTSVFFGLIGLILLLNLLNKKYSQAVSAATIISIAFATNLLFYGSIDVVNSHAVSFFAVSFFLTLVFQKNKSWFVLGLALALIGLERQQDLIFGLLIFIPLKIKSRGAYKILREFTFERVSWLWKKNISFRERTEDASKFLLATKATIGFILGFSPQLLAWQLLNGNFLTNPYLSGSEGFNFTSPQFLQVLFSPTNGLLLWTPIILLSIAGLIRSRNKLFLIIFLIQLYIVSSWSSWNQGASYSGRMFVSCLPLLAFGLADFYQWLTTYHFRLQHFLYIFVLPLSFINIILIIFFLLTL